MQNPKKIFKQYQKTNRGIFKSDEDAKGLFKAIRSGDRNYAKVHRTEDTARDITWVGKLEEAIPHLQTIVDNPRSFIKSVEYLVPAELAKKTGPESVVHLATHSQYVKSVDKKGDVVPSKVLTTEAELDLQIYENRFVMTLLKRLHLYIERRYVYLKHFAALQDTDVLYLDNHFKLGETDVKTTTTIQMSTPAEASRALRIELDASLAKVELMRKYVAYFVTSRFMKEDMKGARPVIPPVMQTNMIKSSPDYHAAYQLWLFLNEEEHANMEFIVNEEIKGLTKDEETRIDFLNYLTTLDLMTGARMRNVRLTKTQYKATILKSVDDMLFLNDKFEPFELVRADQKYYEDLAEPVKKKLEGKSKKVVDQVFKAEKKKLAEIERQKQAALALERRKAAQAEKLKREQEKEAEREAEEAKKREEAAALAREQAKADELETLRHEVKKTAEEDKESLIKKEDVAAPELAVLEPEKAAETFKKLVKTKSKSKGKPKAEPKAETKPKKRKINKDTEAEEAEKEGK